MTAIKIQYRVNNRVHSTTIHPLIARYFLDAYHKKNKVTKWNSDNFWLKRSSMVVDDYLVDNGWLWKDSPKVLTMALKELGYLDAVTTKDELELKMMRYIADPYNRP